MSLRALLNRGALLNRSAFLCLTLGGFSCSEKAQSSTGGVKLEEQFGKDGRSCGRGLAVVMTDYESTNVALLSLEGETLSSSFISSASAETKLNAPLSGDVYFPSSRMEDELVLIDAYPGSVLSFVKLESAEVRAQLSVRTGFNANPQDYLQLKDGRVLVSRLEKNPRGGSEAYDEGDDLVWVNAKAAELTGRVDLGDAHDGERARPSALLLAEDMIFVSLSGHSPDFQSAPDARIVALDPDDASVLFSHVIEGVKNCGALALSPDGRELALSCSGLMNDEANKADPPNSALVMLSIREDREGLNETMRILASDLNQGPFGFSIAYAAPDLLLASTFGAIDGADAGRPDRVFSIETGSKKKTALISSKNEAFNLGDIQCMEACGVCFVADAEREFIHRLDIDESGEIKRTTHQIETDIDLPPRRLGWL